MCSRFKNSFSDLFKSTQTRVFKAKQMQGLAYIVKNSIPKLQIGCLIILNMYSLSENIYVFVSPVLYIVAIHLLVCVMPMGILFGVKDFDLYLILSNNKPLFTFIFMYLPGLSTSITAHLPKPSIICMLMQIIGWGNECTHVA